MVEKNYIKFKKEQESGVLVISENIYKVNSGQILMKMANEDRTTVESRITMEKYLPDTEVTRRRRNSRRSQP